jgi:hypothetical protein
VATASATTVSITGQAQGTAPTIKATNGAINISFPSWVEIPLDKEMIAFFKKRVPNNLPGLMVQIFVSDESDIAKVTQNLDKAFIDAGYKGADGKPGLDTTPDGALGFYLKSGAADALLFISAVNPATLESQKVRGVNADISQKLIDQIRGKKFIMVMISGQGMAKAFNSAVNITPTTASPLSFEEH